MNEWITRGKNHLLNAKKRKKPQIISATIKKAKGKEVNLLTSCDGEPMSLKIFTVDSIPTFGSEAKCCLIYCHTLFNKQHKSPASFVPSICVNLYIIFWVDFKKPFPFTPISCACSVATVSIKPGNFGEIQG